MATECPIHVHVHIELGVLSETCSILSVNLLWILNRLQTCCLALVQTRGCHLSEQTRLPYFQKVCLYTVILLCQVTLHLRM